MAELVALLYLFVTGLQTPGLQIVVISGEDAVNIIQQKTAVAPIVEVRDRNGLPVAGATVTFAIQGGGVATFPGATSTMTIATNAAGRAAAAAINPLGAGSFQIQVQAVFQGQTVAATIAQSNVLTAAEAVAGTASGSAAAGTTSTAAAGGGGLSATTIGIVGAAVGGGALAATQLGGDQPAAAAPSPVTRTLSSPISFTNVHLISFPTARSCTIDHGISGTITMELMMTGESVTGNLRYTGTDAQVAATCQVTSFTSGGWKGEGPVTGTRGALSSRIVTTFTSTADIPAGSINSVQMLAVFEGAFDGTVVSGNFTYEFSSDISGTTTQTTRSHVVVPITLR